MPKNAKSFISAACVLSTALVLSACTESRLHISDNVGQAVRQNVVAQVADPDAQYAGLPAPGSHGRRVGSAQNRYVRGKVIEPATTNSLSTQGGQSAGGGGDEGNE